MAFDPDEYLGLTRRDADADPDAFDPDAYLKGSGFDPDKYLADDAGLLTKATDLPRAASGGAWRSLGRGVQGLVALNDAVGAGMAKLLPDSVANALAEPIPEAVNVFGAVNKTGKAAEAVGDFVAPPVERENLATDVAQGVGQVVVQATLSAANPAMGLGLMAGDGAEQQDRRAELAGEKGAPGAEAAIMQGALVTGALEKVQLGRLMGKVPYLGDLIKKLPTALREKWLGKTVDATAAGLGEALQEVTEGVVHDAIEYGSFNDDVEFLQGWEREAQAAGVTGTIFRAAINAMTPGKARPAGMPTRESVDETGETDALPDPETARVQAERIVEPEPVAVAGEAAVKSPNKGNIQSMPYNARGDRDILNDIEDLGGVRTPGTLDFAGGEYDDFDAVFSGLAARLKRGNENAEALDQLVGPLRELGHDVSDTNDLKELIRNAPFAREQVRNELRQEQAVGRWMDQAMLGNRAKNQPKAELVAQPASKMLVGDTFKVAGVEAKVVEVDGFTGEVTVETSDKLGGRHVLEPEDAVWFDRKSYQFGDAYYKRQTEVDLGDDLPFARRAYHGSPHRFDKFTTAAMGTGEGAQAYGWGMYFAGKKEVAEFYREALSGYAQPITLDGRAYKPAAFLESHNIRRELLRANKEDPNKVNLDGAILLAEKLELSNNPDVANSAKQDLRALLEVKASGGLKYGKPGALYQVDLKPEDDQYLLWDQPLSAQSERVKKAWLTAYGRQTNQDNPQFTHDIDGSEMYDMLSGGARMADRDKGETSRLMLRNGIRGIKYSNEGSRNYRLRPPFVSGRDWTVIDDAGKVVAKGPRDQVDGYIEEKGNYNYVIFDDLDVSVEAIEYAKRMAQDPQAAWKSALLSHESKEPVDRWSDREALAERQKAWRENAETLAPGVMKRFELAFGEAKDLAERGRVDSRKLTGQEQAAYDAKERIFYLFDTALERGSEANTLVNLQHEMAHAHWDTLEGGIQDRLATQWEAETAAKTGPLYHKGTLKRGVAQGVETDLREWYAERIAWTNHKWARERLGKAAPATPGGSATVARAARYFRELMRKVETFYRENFGSDKLVKDYRAYLDQGPKWEAETLRGARPARSMVAATSFAQREIDAAKGLSATESELRVRLRSLRERFKGSPVGKLIRKELTTVGTLPEVAWKRMAERNQATAAVMREADFAAKDLNAAVTRTYGGWSSLPKGMERKLNDVLAGRERWENIPKAIAKPLAKMRQTVDRMSKRLMEEGFATGELRGVIEDRLGFYLNRSYKRYDLPGWGKKVMDAKPGSELAKVRESARQLIHDTMREQVLTDLADKEFLTRKAEQPPLLPTQRQAAPDQAGQAIQEPLKGVPSSISKPPGKPVVRARDRRTPLYWEILDRLRADKDLQPEAAKVEGLLASLAGAGDVAVPDFTDGAAKLGKDLTIFKKRKSLDPRIRRLMGEYSDPRINFGRSVSKIAQVVETHKMLTDLKQMGVERGWMSVDGPRGEMVTPIASKGSKSLEPLNGVYTTPEIAEAFQEQFAGTPAGTGWRIWWAVNGYAKIAKTVLSPVAQMGNVVANFWPMVANGYLNPAMAKQVGEALRGDLASDSPQKSRDYVVKLTRLGVLGESVNANELREAMRNAHVVDGGNVDKWTEGVMARTLRAPFRVAAKGYQLGDEMFRVYAFEHEKAAWRKALPGESIEKVEQIAAERVNNVMATYSRIPKFFQRIRRGGLTGSFVSFSMESMRTLYHTVGYAVTDLKSDNPEIRKMGARRMAGTILSAGIGLPVVQMISQALTGVSGEDDEDYREVMAPWNKNSKLIYLEKGDGEFRAVDASRLSYYGYPHKVLTAALQGEDWEESLVMAAGEMAEPVFGEGIVAKSIVDVLRDQTADGRSVVKRGSVGWDAMQQRLEHLYQAVEPGVVTQARRVMRAATGYESETGRTYDLGDELVATVTGARPLSVDLLKNYAFKVGDYKGAKSDAAAAFWREWNNKQATRESVLAAYEETNERRRKVFEDMAGLTEMMLRQKVSPREIARTLYQRSISEEETAMLMLGVYQDWDPKLDPRENPENQEKRLRGLGL